MQASVSGQRARTRHNIMNRAWKITGQKKVTFCILLTLSTIGRANRTGQTGWTDIYLQKTFQRLNVLEGNIIYSTKKRDTKMQTTLFFSFPFLLLCLMEADFVLIRENIPDFLIMWESSFKRRLAFQLDII